MIGGFINNKYYRWYLNIILKSSDIRIKGKTEHHHILPKSIFPEYDNLVEHSWNGVHLTYKEHIICHKLLFRITEGSNKSKMFYALVRMFNTKQHQKLMSPYYENLKKEYTDYHWSNHKTQKEISAIYKKRGNQTDNCAGAIKWWKSLSNEDQKAMHKRQALKRCKGWWISKKDDSIEEFYVLNLKEWCINNNVDDGHASSIANKDSVHYAKAAKGWRFRKDGNPQLPNFVDKRLIGHENIACKGKSWKLVEGTRVWFEKE